MPPSGSSLRAALLLFALPALLLTTEPTSAKPTKDEIRAMKREGLVDDAGGKSKKRDARTDAGGNGAAMVDSQTRTLDRLREKLEVPDDTEWALIVERIAKIEELRRSTWNNVGAKGSLTSGDKAKRSSGSSSSPERDALRSALSDNLPDAEIKSRLARAHQIHQQNEARLAQAQANLRAVLSIRQEAIVVTAGLLPP